MSERCHLHWVRKTSAKVDLDGFSRTKARHLFEHAAQPDTARYRMVLGSGFKLSCPRKRHFEDPRTSGYHRAIPGGRGCFIGRRRESVAANVSAPSTANIATSELHGGRRGGPSAEM